MQKKHKKKYGLTDPESYTQEKYDEYLKDIENYYNTTINNKIAQNKDFQLLTSAFDKKKQVSYPKITANLL